MRKIIASSVLLLAATPTLFAHAGHGETGFVAGATHPLMGFDHLLAMVAVGLMGVRCSLRNDSSRHALWQVPASFMAAMVVGGLLAAGGMPMPLAEWGIALSVLVFGVIVALARAPKTWVACAVAASFALLHGHAHVAEMSGTSMTIFSVTGYLSGVLLMTVMLHALGVAAGWWIAKSWQQSAIRAMGMGVALASISLFIGLL